MTKILTINSTHRRNRMADEPRSKLLPKAAGPYGIINFTSHTITINEDVISSVISIDRATPAPQPNTPIAVEHSIHNAQSNNASPDSTPETTGYNSHPAVEHARTTRKVADNYDLYVVNHIVLHINTKDGIRCIICGYRHTTANDMAKTSNNILEHFITRYWAPPNLERRAKLRRQ